MTTVGKKRKKIYVYRGGSSKRTPVIPLLIVGGIAIWYFMTKDNQTAAASTLPPADTGLTDTGQLYNPYTGELINPVDGGQAYTSPTPVTSILTGDAQTDNYLRSMLTVFPATSPYFVNWKTRNGADLSTLWSLTYYFKATDTKYWDAFTKMSSPELAMSWRYVSNYLSKGIPLLNESKKLPSGAWDNTNPGDPATYTAIQTIHAKYGIF